MKKRNLLLQSVVIILSVFSLKADPVKIKVTEAGTGKALFEKHKDALEIAIEGDINQIDLLNLHSTFRKANSIDLSKANIVAYSDDITYIDYAENELTNALANSPNLVKLILPESIQKIASRALYKCPKLESLTIPCKSVPKTAKGGIIEAKHKLAVTLFVPKELIATYEKKMKKAPWGYFKLLKEIPSPSPWDKLIWDNVYGVNYFPQNPNGKNKVFYAAYFENKTDKTVNEIEFSYWYDDGEAKGEAENVDAPHDM